MEGQPGRHRHVDRAEYKTMTLRQGIKVSNGDFLTTDKDGMLIKPAVTPDAPTQFPDGFIVAAQCADASGKDVGMQVVTAGSMILVRLAEGVRAGQRLESVPNSNNKFRAASHDPIPHSIIGTVVEVGISKRLSDDGDVGLVALGCV